MSVDTRRPKGRKARKIRAARGPVKEYRCQFCSKAAPIEEWTKDGYDHCPHCSLMPEVDDGLCFGWGN